MQACTPLYTIHKPSSRISGGVTCMVRRGNARGIGWDEKQSAKMYPCLLVESGLRAHDDDPRVPVLNNRHGRQ
jgi:hypothetical protein